MIDYDNEYHSCPLHGYRIKDGRGCWVCLDELRQQDKLEAKENKPKKLYQIKPISKGQQSINSELARIKRDMLKEYPYCFTTGRTDNLTLSHIIPRPYKQFITERRNLVLEHIEAHTLYEHDKEGYAATYPAKWQEKLKIAFSLCPEFYFKLINKLKQAS